MDLIKLISVYLSRRLIFPLFFYTSTSLPAQCPVRDVVFKRLLQEGTALVPQPSQLVNLLNEYRKCYPEPDTMYQHFYRIIAYSFYHKKDFAKAADWNIAAIGNLRKYNPVSTKSVDKKLTSYYYNAIIYYDSLGEHQKRMNAVDSCLAIEERIGSDLYSTYILRHKVKWLNRNGDYAQCIRYAVFSNNLIAKNLVGVDSLDFLFFNITYMAQSLQMMGAGEEAEKMIRDAIAVSLRNNSRYLGSLYSVEGLILRENKKFREALHSYYKTWQIEKRTKYNKGVAEALAAIAKLMHQEFKSPDSALYYSRQALHYANDIDSLLVLNIMGRAMIAKGEFDAGFLLYQQALDQVKPGITLDELLAAPLEITVNEKSTEYLTDLIVDWGNARLARFKATGERQFLTDAISVYEKGDQFLEKIKSEHLHLQSKLFWRAYSRQFYENAIEAARLANDGERMFFFFERSRAVLLNDNINSDRGVSESDMIRQLELARNAADLQEKLKTISPGSPAYAAIDSELFKVTRIQENLTRKTNQAVSGNVPVYPSFSNVRKQLLVKHQALVEVFVGDSSVYIYMLTRDTWKVLKVDKLIYEHLSTRFLTAMSKPSQHTTDFANFREAAGQLYKLIFEPLAISPGRIIISPDGEYFPFEALVKTGISGKVEYLLKDYAVTYTYSAGYLLNAPRHQDTRGKDFLGFAPVQYSAQQNLSPLINSERSLHKIAACFDNPVEYINSDANLKNFTNHFSRYKIIHLYSHAAANLVSGEPVIYFRDSMLELNKLVPPERPVTSLVVLAACESGIGKFYSGEGVFSFNRAFAAIGIPSAVVNLWTVENKSTYQLNEFFYRYLSQGNELDVALRKAKLEYLSLASADRQLPYYWAASVLTGRPDALMLHGTAARYIWLTVSVVFFMILGAIYWARRQANNIF